MIRRPFVAAVSLTVLTLASPSTAADRPPEDLHLVGDHWTAWDPPAPPPDAQVYIIVPGDTLWDLARKFYGDPYLWPQLWERNQYIQDAHWIYPGDPLVIGPQAAAAESLDTVDFGTEGEASGSEATTDPAAEDISREVQPVEVAAGAPVPLGTESDIYCTGYVGDLEESFPHTLVGSEYEALSPPLEGVGRAQGQYGSADTVKYGLDTGDIVYVDGGRASGLEPGSLLTIVVPGRSITHPVTKKVFGRIYRYTGRLRILSVQEDTAIAEITTTCDPITVGSRLKTFLPEPVPLASRTVMRPVNFPSPASSLAGAPVILGGHEDQVALGQDNVVYIDRGADADVTPGDIYTIYRLHPKGSPPIILGEVAVLSVHAHSSIAKIIASRHTVYRGDLLELK